MITVPQARTQAQKRLRTNLNKWLEQTVIQTDIPAPLLSITLHPPTEKQMLSNQQAAQDWAQSWSSVTTGNGIEVEWESRLWRSIGRQRIPVRAHFAHAHAVAAFSGGEPAAAWHLLYDRTTAVLATLLGDRSDPTVFLATIRRHSVTLRNYAPEEFDLVLATTQWLIDNPITGLRPRQVGIRGVDSKWFTSHRALLKDLVQASTGSEDLGIVDSDLLLRIRILDPGLLPGGPHDFAASPGHLAALNLRPTNIFIFENLESVLTMPPLPGAVVLHGGGYAVDLLQRIAWLQHAPVWYWGDLDSHGFAILNRLRGYLPHARSVLMDTVTLQLHADLCVPEPKPNTGQFPNLNAAEAQTLMKLREYGNIRLEQERIPWNHALSALELC
ncbi:Wadjet anti-phage system protein JetD domain-containing protein [Jonesiaceae bacterium BS-20]|uniref:Wadjet anti-phage system protein JetD domain-containing protein n=1 Tax=Jonesiaceae bacterium BS-20 TaxID=3120821 RepID=A0AAU7DTW6_9MICO